MVGMCNMQPVGASFLVWMIPFYTCLCDLCGLFVRIEFSHNWFSLQHGQKTYALDTLQFLAFFLLKILNALKYLSTSKNLDVIITYELLMSKYAFKIYLLVLNAKIKIF